MTHDVEKRWSDPKGLRRAAVYVGCVILAAVAIVAVAVITGSDQADACRDAALRICQNPERLLIAAAPPTILLFGGLGAFLKTYRVWRVGGVWPIWQGAGWALFALMLVYIAMSTGVLVG